jgi:hypothetical protein
MSQALKVALISAFVFPGSGHLLLKQYVRGTLLAGVSIACTWVLLSIAMEKAQQISLRIQSGEIPLDANRIMAEISQLVAGSNTLQADVATYVLITCWVVGTIDAYRAGRLQDKHREHAELPR